MANNILLKSVADRGSWQRSVAVGGGRWRLVGHVHGRSQSFAVGHGRSRLVCHVHGRSRSVVSSIRPGPPPRPAPSPSPSPPSHPSPPRPPSVLLAADGGGQHLGSRRVLAAHRQLHGDVLAERHLGAHQHVVPAAVDARQVERVRALALRHLVRPLARLQPHELHHVAHRVCRTNADGHHHIQEHFTEDSALFQENYSAQK